jgi:hypothetical protein
MSSSRSYSSSEMRTFFSQGPLVEDEVRMESLQQDILPNFCNLRVYEEVCLLVTRTLGQLRRITPDV